MRLEVSPATAPLKGELRPPGDKSISHRALIFGGLAAGDSPLEGLLEAGDTMATQHAMSQLGARFSRTDSGLLVEGVGARGLSEPADVLDMGNSGTAMRLLTGVLAGQPFNSVLSGDQSLNSRPMKRIMEPLGLMGARIQSEPDGRAPLRIEGNPALRGIRYQSPVASAQIKSCLLLAGLFAQGETVISEPRLSRDHSERMLPAFGIEMGPGISLQGGQRLQACPVQVPADPSSAAFLVVAALLVPGSDVLLSHVGLNPTRTAFFRAVLAMGGELTVQNEREAAGERVGDLRVRYSPRLQAIDLPADWIPAMIDEVPILLALAACAEGTTRVRDAAELRVKESDRLAVMARGLEAMGCPVQEYPDGIDVTGADCHFAVVDSAHDHRCAMSLAVLGLRAEGGVSIRDAQYIDTSYPSFRAHLEDLGVALRLLQESPV